ncbi:SMI1-KNR4 cell-wall [Pseudobutyrivibrio sp. YE44]|uniref:SMI1/KNR4 family protein n=1 Tax=Pseudobutyrivibrio sp. YE44 TaxID=1520802 RepID=UPI00087FA1BD|nr:SMI1/KNR4 family protein [Pseudobutyrivibrio sp. YE44]SDB44876.1 SMI1-KNR4 cell-wall [Pseudobutyrivibrio sp. YE44]
MGLLEVMQKYDDFAIGKPVSIEEIKQAERELQLSFSNEYREYLVKAGIATANAHEITGITTDERLDVVYLSKKNRNKNIEDSRYVVEDIAIDKVLIWQDTEGVIYQTIGKTPGKKIANSLAEYIQIKV